MSMKPHQPDLFGRAPAQGELFRAVREVPEVPPVTPESVRAKMQAMLAQLRAADSMPWPERTARINEAIFPQMANWLPDDEAEQLCFAFREEYIRLEWAA
jgi:hypothetical protein